MKIKKFLAMVSLSAFVLTNVIPIGVLAGGENFERKPLNFSGVTLTRSEVKKNINDFKRDYFKYAWLLSDKAEMERRDLSKAYDVYKRTGSNIVLRVLYRMVASSPWLTDDDCVDLIRAISGDLNGIRNDFDSYSDILQNIASIALRSFNGPKFDSSIACAMENNLEHLCNELGSARVTDPSIDGYLNSARQVSRYVYYIVIICTRLELI